MREILFRGRRMDNGEWVYGYYLGPVGPLDIHEISDINDTTGHRYEVYPATVGQYTGLTDKNGQKIFEGDVVKGLFNYKCVIGHITYGSNATFYIERDGLLGIYLDNAADWLSVIGNIHDNPEMVGGAEHE